MPQSRICLIFICLLLLTVLIIATDDDKLDPESRVNAGKTIHTVHLPNTDHELHVYEVFGQEPGNTVMIIGGIHGNEPGGYLAADKYVDLSLKRGNLIIVPRANLDSILSNNRGKHGDYNRKFNVELDDTKTEDKIILVLKELMERSDLVLNLHDGSGFFREKWIDKLHNPYRYGQSIISDCELFEDAGNGHVLELGKIGRQIVKEINKQIEQEAYHFTFANHDSVSPDTKYPEMRKTATYYALTEHHIPAFGIETSKSLPTTEMKVAHQIFAINAFLDLFDVVPIIPTEKIDEPMLQYIVVTINDESQIVVKKDNTLTVANGDRVKIDHIVANYERHLFADFVGIGNYNDNALEVRINKPYTVRVRKDAEVCGEVKIVPGEARDQSITGLHVSNNQFMLKINGALTFVDENQILDVVKGDEIQIVDFLSPHSTNGINVNFVGFVGDPKDNRGEDRGYTANTAQDLLKNWSVNGKGEKYQIAAKRSTRIISSIYIKLVEPQWSYLVYKAGNELRIIEKNQVLKLESTNDFSVVDVKTETGIMNDIRFELTRVDDKQKQLLSNKEKLSANTLNPGKYTLHFYRFKLEVGQIQIEVN